jgi:hypothetical protein
MAFLEGDSQTQEFAENTRSEDSIFLNHLVESSVCVPLERPPPERGCCEVLRLLPNLPRPTEPIEQPPRDELADPSAPVSPHDEELGHIANRLVSRKAAALLHEREAGQPPVRADQEGV